MYKGVIIEESLANKSILSKVKIESTKIEPIAPEHKTPWLKQWTLPTVSVPEETADEIAKELSESFDYSHSSAWYADFKNDKLITLFSKIRSSKLTEANWKNIRKQLT